MSKPANQRRSGILLPLFSSPATSSWGIGDLRSVMFLVRWLAAAGQRVLQLLPLNEMAPGQQSPYSAISAMAIDPIFISLPDVSEFAELGGETRLSADNREALALVRGSAAIDYKTVRRLKLAALTASFELFYQAAWCHDTERAREFRAFLTDEAWWLEDYALFRAIHEREGEQPWQDWAPELQQRDLPAIKRVRRELERDVLRYQYWQWLASKQWAVVREDARANGVALFGDLPFMVDGDSADVWARQHQFHMDATIGVPPDAFSATGQDWGMPVYAWDAHEADQFQWLRDRARRSADLYDGYRIDHLVGFYRTYARPRANGTAYFTPAKESDQLALGERLLKIFRNPGAEIVAEDLGTVPDFVRESLVRLGIPGLRVFRWERHWHVEGQPFRDPSEYPTLSVATTGTHDTEPLAVWWPSAPLADRRAVSHLPTVHGIAESIDAGSELTEAPFVPLVRDTLVQAVLASKSQLALIPIQDVFGWSTRINQPATVDDANWTFQLPWPSDRLHDIPAAVERQKSLARWTSRWQR
jgi:4-alpha-glucanotransferase